MIIWIFLFFFIISLIVIGASYVSYTVGKNVGYRRGFWEHSYLSENLLRTAVDAEFLLKRQASLINRKEDVEMLTEMANDLQIAVNKVKEMRKESQL